jgi:hypothetical protein
VLNHLRQNSEEFCGKEPPTTRHPNVCKIQKVYDILGTQSTGPTYKTSCGTFFEQVSGADVQTQSMEDFRHLFWSDVKHGSRACFNTSYTTGAFCRISRPRLDWMRLVTNWFRKSRRGTSLIKNNHSKTKTNRVVIMSEAESAFGSNGFQMMGIMNALKTGDVHVVSK